MALQRPSQSWRNRVEKIFLLLLVPSLFLNELHRVSAVDLSAPHATYYGGSDTSGTNNGACGYGNNFAFGYGSLTTALSQTLFNQGYACGACYQIFCIGNPSCSTTSVVVTATNLCPQGSYSGVCDFPQDHFDLSQPAFAQIAPSFVGVVNVNYQRVLCSRSGGIKFSLQGHTYFLQVLISNVAGMGDVVAVSIKGTNSAWIPMARGWGVVYNTATVFDGQGLSFITSNAEGGSVTSLNVAGAYWQYGQTYEGLQF